MSVTLRPRKSLQSNDAWRKIVDATNTLRILRSLTDINIRRATEAVAILKDVQTSSKRKKYQVFLHNVILQCGPSGVLVSAVALGQNNVASMNRFHRTALVQKLENHKDEIPLNDPSLRLLAAHYHIPDTVEELHAIIHHEQHRYQEGSGRLARLRQYEKLYHTNMQKVHEDTAPSIETHDEDESNTLYIVGGGAHLSVEATSEQDHDLRGGLCGRHRALNIMRHQG